MLCVTNGCPTNLDFGEFSKSKNPLVSSFQKRKNQKKIIVSSTFSKKL
jgi:hypothetical protein